MVHCVLVRCGLIPLSYLHMDSADPYCIYCIRAVSVDFRRDQQPNFESDFMFHVCRGCC